MVQRIYDGTVPPLCAFIRRYGYGGGQRHNWCVAIPRTVDVAAGDIVKILRRNGSTTWVQLFYEHPFSTKKAHSLRTRWRFDNIDDESVIDQLEKALFTRETFDAYRVVIKEQCDIIESQNATMEMQAELIKRLRS